MVYTSSDQERGYASQGRALYGLKAIGAYMGGKSDKTVRKLIKEDGMPAVKIGGEWTSNEGWIDEWRRTGLVNKRYTVCCY